MTPNREEALFALALEKSADKRTAFLDAICEGDVTLRQRLEALLAAHEQPDGVLPTQDETARPTLEARFADEPRDEAVGQTIGRYKLLERLARVAVAWSMSRSRPSRCVGARPQGHQAQMPLYRDLGSSDKQIKHLDSGHAPPLQKTIEEASEWLNPRLEHPTSNIERRTAKRLRPSMFDVQRSMFWLRRQPR